MLTTYAGDAQVLRAIKAGARGYSAKKRFTSGTAGDYPGRPCREKIAIG